MTVTQRPVSVARATWLVRGLVAWSALAALLTVLLRDELVLAWARGNKAAQEVLDEGGLEALRASSIRIPGFVALAIVLCVVYSALVWVLLAFFRTGHGWARLSLTATAVFTSFAILVGLARNVPALFVGLSVVALILHAGLLWFLWQRDTSDFLRAH